MVKKTKLIIGISLLVLVLVFIVQNTDVVTVEFLFWGLSISRALLIFLTAITGIIIGWFLRSVIR
ncbi:MAG: LapA family protein [Chitinivibrionia bacterium]|nr:LapA family protein [Chitinivibrionia bacterium]